MDVLRVTQQWHENAFRMRPHIPYFVLAGIAVVVWYLLRGYRFRYAMPAAMIIGTLVAMFLLGIASFAKEVKLL